MSTWVVETISGQPITEKQEQKQKKKKKVKITEANVCKSKKHYHRKMLKKHQKKGKVSGTNFTVCCREIVANNSQMNFILNWGRKSKGW